MFCLIKRRRNRRAFQDKKETIDNVMEEQKLKNSIDMTAPFDQVLGNPAKNHYNIGVTKGKHNKEEKVKAVVAQGGTTTPDYNNAHIEGLNLLRKIVFPTKHTLHSAHGYS